MEASIAHPPQKGGTRKVYGRKFLRDIGRLLQGYVIQSTPLIPTEPRYPAHPTAYRTPLLDSNQILSRPGIVSDCVGRFGPQSWRVVTPTLKQKQLLPPGRRERKGILENFLAKNRSFGAFSKLVRYKRPPSSSYDVAEDTSTSLTRSAFEKLPPEITWMIIERLGPDQVDVMALGTCSSHLFRQIVRYIGHTVHCFNGLWAGTPLIALGGLAEDVPPVLHDLGFPPIFPDHQLRVHSDTRVWFQYILRHYQEVPPMDVGWDWLHALYAHSAEYDDQRLLKELDSRIRQAVQIPRTGTRARWILRNLTTRGFVRLVAMESMTSADLEADDGYRLRFPNCIFIEDFPYFGLDIVLLSRIGWSDVDPAHGHYGFRTPGTWAGHRFDIVPTDEYDLEDGWEDITESTIAEAKESGLPAPPFLLSTRTRSGKKIFEQRTGGSYA